MSISTRSGSSSAASVIASAPSAAMPSTSMRPSSPSLAATLSANSRSSSTSSTPVRPSTLESFQPEARHEAEPSSDDRADRARRRAGRLPAHARVARRGRPAAEPGRRGGLDARAEARPGDASRRRRPAGPRHLRAAVRRADAQADAEPRRGPIRVLRRRRRGPAARLGDTRRGPNAPQSDGLRGRREDDLHDELCVVGDRADGDRARRRARRRHLSHPGGDGRGGRELLPRRRPRGLSRPLPPVAGPRRRREPHRSRRTARPCAPRRGGRRAPPRAARCGSVCRGARDDARRALLAADPRLVDSPQVRARQPGAQGERPDDRTPLPPLWPLRRPRLLALPHARLGRRRRVRSFRRRPVLDHPYFGRLTFMPGGYWEGELAVPGLPERVGLVVPAPATGPDDAQAAFCLELLADLDGLFERCRPLFEPEFETWAGKPFRSEWRDDFSLTGLGVPECGDEREPWDAGYFVDAANHYFTAHFERGRASYLTVDG